MGHRAHDESQGAANGAALVTSADDHTSVELVTADEMARALGVSRATIDRARKAGRLPAVRNPDGRGWAFRRTEVIEMGEVRQRVPASAADRERQAGERDAAVVAMLEENATVPEIVVATKTPLDVVVRLRAGWIAARQADAQQAVHTCGCGALPDPRTARCTRCHARSRVLSDADAALLAGREPPPPNTCTCKGCSAVVPIERAEHLCASCASKLTVGVRGGVLVVLLAGAPVRTISVQETRGIVGQLDHLVQRPAAPARAPAPAPATPDALATAANTIMMLASLSEQQPKAGNE